MPFTPLNLRRWLPALLGVVLALGGLAGCGDRDRLSYATEADEPYYREGLSLLKSGRRQEALTAFLKVIDKRGEDAPESHLEIGLLYLHHISDPLSAIYHFKKYLALRPNSPQSPLVRQRIDAAIREFARTLPAQPLETATKRVDLIAAMDKLKEENDQLKQQLAEVQANREIAPAATINTEVAASRDLPRSAPDNKFTINFDSVPTVSTRAVPVEPTVTVKTKTQPSPTRPATAPRAVNQARPVVTPPAPAALARGAARKHIVRKGDTLSNLAQRYYTNRAKWRDIYAANRKVMKNEGDIRVGMELVIP